MIHTSKCIVLGSLHTFPTEGILIGPHPPPFHETLYKFYFTSYFPLNILAFETPPFGISSGYGYFLGVQPNNNFDCTLIKAEKTFSVLCTLSPREIDAVLSPMVAMLDITMNGLGSNPSQDHW